MVPSTMTALRRGFRPTSRQNNWHPKSGESSALWTASPQTPWLASSGLLQAIFYVVAGMGWVLPAMPIVSWMQRPEQSG